MKMYKVSTYVCGINIIALWELHQDLEGRHRRTGKANQYNDWTPIVLEHVQSHYELF